MSFPFDLFVSNEIPFPPPPWIGDRPVDFNLGYVSPCPQQFPVYAEQKRTLQHAFTSLHGQAAAVGTAGYIAAIPLGFWQQYHTLCISQAHADALTDPAWRAWTTAVWQLHSAVAEWATRLHALADPFACVILSPLSAPGLKAVYAHLDAFRAHMLTFVGEKMHIEQLCAVALTRRVTVEFSRARRVLVAAKIWIDCVLGAQVLVDCMKYAWSGTAYPVPCGFAERCAGVQSLFVFEHCIGNVSLGVHWRRCAAREKQEEDVAADGDYGRLRAFYYMLKRHVDQVGAWKNALEVCSGGGSGDEAGSGSGSELVSGDEAGSESRSERDSGDSAGSAGGSEADSGYEVDLVDSSSSESEGSCSG